MMLVIIATVRAFDYSFTFFKAGDTMTKNVIMKREMDYAHRNGI